MAHVPVGEKAKFRKPGPKQGDLIGRVVAYVSSPRGEWVHISVPQDSGEDKLYKTRPSMVGPA